GGEHVEATEALAYEVRRRLETRVEGDAASRHEGDVLFAEKPRGGLGHVSRLGVLRKQADDATPESQVQGREQQRQSRLGDARVRGAEIGRERAEALAPGAPAREDVEHLPRHDY